MKKNKHIILIFVFLLFTFYGYCQINNTNQKQINDHSDSLKIETNEYNIIIKDVVSNEKYTKFKIRITNKTLDYLLFKGEECVLVTETTTINTEEKPVFIEPFFTRSKVILFKGIEGLHFNKIRVDIKGLYRIPVEENIYNAPDFKLPPSLKDFKAGEFECAYISTGQEIQSFWVKFSCKYNGQKIGYVNPANCVIKLPDGKEFAATNLKSKPEMMLPGKKLKFTVDFQIPASVTQVQFTNMNIVWKDVFSESAAIPLPNPKASFEIDPSGIGTNNE